MDIRKLDPTPAGGSPADRAGETNDARRIHDARRANEARQTATRRANSDVVDTSHADKVEKIALRARAVIDDRVERVRGREDELRARGDDAQAIRRAARRVLALLDRAEFDTQSNQTSKTPNDGKV